MINEMKYAKALYEEGSFSKAAKKLYISQPALSAAIKKLEDEIGMPLFDRSANPIKPTEAGMFYLKSAGDIFRIEDTMHEYFEAVKNLKVGSLNIGTTTSYCCYSLPIHLKPFLAKHPGIKINLTEDTSNESLARKLREGELDLVLTSNPDGFRTMKKQLFLKEHLIMAVPAQWNINRRFKDRCLAYTDIMNGVHKDDNFPSVSLKSFKDMPYISLRKESELYHRLEEMFNKSGFEPRYHMYMDQMITSYFMVYHNYGYAIIRDETVNIVPKSEISPHVCFYKINNALAERDVYFYYRDLQYLSAAVKNFLSYTAEAANTIKQEK